MGSLQFDDEEEEHRFFDARECSVSSAPSDDGFGLSSSFYYELWTKTPESIQQRRKNFFEQMGFDSDETISKEDVDRITSSGAVAFYHEFSSIHSSSSTDDLSTSHKSNADISGIGNLSGVENCGEDEFGKENEEKKVDGRKNSFKKLLKRLSSITYKKEVSRNVSPVKGTEVQRVMVRHCRKRLKELSALFMGQDICAHDGSISTIKFSLDGRYLATGGEDGIVCIWQVLVDMSLSKIDASNFDPLCVYFRVNNRSQLAPLISEKEEMLKIRRTRDSACVILPPAVFRISEKPLHEFHGHSDEILDLSWSKNNVLSYKLLSTSSKLQIMVDLKTGHELFFSVLVQCLLSASTDNTVRTWQVGCENCLSVFRHNNYVTCVQFNPVDDSRFVSGSIDGKVRIWEINGCQVVGWTDIRDIVTAVCFRPNGQGLVVGSTKGNCRFYNIADDFFQLEAQIGLHRKNKVQCKRVTGFQFFPQDPDKLMVTCACSRIRILEGINVIAKYKGNRSSGNQLLASFTPDGKHIISTSNDLNVCLWNCIDQFEHSQPHPKTVSSWEWFSANASVAIPWFGFKTTNSDSSLLFDEDETTTYLAPPSSPVCFSLEKELVLESSAKGSATWPEEKLGCPFIHKSDYKFLKTCQSKTNPHAWDLVIVPLVGMGELGRSTITVYQQLYDS